MLQEPFYNPKISYEENLANGPFGPFADGKIFENKGEPKFDFFGQKVFLPFGIPAGPLLNGKFVKAALDKGFDLPVYKTARTKFYPCHGAPNVLAVKVNGDLTMEMAAGQLVADNNYKEPLCITNSFGVPSADPDVWQPDLAEVVRYAKHGQAVVGSFQGTKNPDGKFESYVADFVLAARLVKETGAKILEVNFSCPNEGTTDLLCFDADRVNIISEAIKNEINDTPLIIKIAYYESNKNLKKLVGAVGKIIDGIAAINTIPAAIIDKNGAQALPGDGRMVSGVCGVCVKWAGLDMVKHLKILRDEMDMKFKIIGVGGVMNAGDFMEYRNIGADAVMSATGAMWNPWLAREIKEKKQ